jgi:hypothetical protein
VKPSVGSTLVSQVDSTHVVVVRWPDTDVAVSCGGAPMVIKGEPIATGLELDPARSNGSQLGKRYASSSGDLELLCVKAGAGSLAADDQVLPVKGARPLPASD